MMFLFTDARTKRKFIVALPHCKIAEPRPHDPNDKSPHVEHGAMLTWKDELIPVVDKFEDLVRTFFAPVVAPPPDLGPSPRGGRFA